MRQGYFLNSTCDMGINKGQRHATLVFLNIDMRHGQGPHIEGWGDGEMGGGGERSVRSSHPPTLTAAAGPTTPSDLYPNIKYA